MPGSGPTPITPLRSSKKVTAISRNRNQSHSKNWNMHILVTADTIGGVKMCMSQFFEWDWFLFLDIAVTFLLERRGVIGVGPLPGILVRRIAKRLLVQRTTGIRKHGHGFAYPNTPGPEMLLPGANLPAIVMFGKNQVGLHPGYPAAGIDQQLSDP